MVHACASYYCTNRQTKGCGLSFHTFPKDPELSKKWIIATKRKKFFPTKWTVLCSKHFTAEDYQLRPNASYPLLKDNAVPSVFDFPAHLAPPPKKKRRPLVRIQAAVTENQSIGVEDEQPLQPQLPDCSQEGEEAASRNSGIREPKSVPSAPTKKVLRRKVKILQQRLKRRDRMIKTMKDLISTLKDKLKAPDSLIQILQENFSGFLLELFNNVLNKKGKSKFRNTFTDKMKEFALTLYFYSPKSYNYVRNLNLCLPNPSTLRKWISSFNCSPGFLQEVFLYLKDNVKQKPYFRQVNLVFDSMSIRKQIIYDDKRGINVGYVDFGGSLKIDNDEEVASEALVFQIVALKGNFKTVVGYFYINKLNAVSLSQLIKMAIIKLHEVGVSVFSVTFDGASSNISAVKKLGCKFPEEPFFRIPKIRQDICVMLDPCHMLKLCRNTLADKRIIQSPTGLIEFKYIERLNTLQKEETLTFCNKLSDKHIFYRNRKMNVRVAAQTLSSSAADAIEFLCLKKHPDFVGSEETVQFIRVIDRLFDYLNSRDPFDRGTKGAIRLDNIDADNIMLSENIRYLSTLKVENVPILDHPRKTFAMGFLVDMYSIKKLRDTLLKIDGFKYLLTYKFSQDHLELFFSCVRSRSGNNDNPNVKQFTWAVRKLMFRNSVRASESSNCLTFEPIQQHNIFEISSAGSTTTHDQDTDENDDDKELDLLSSMIENIETNSYFKENILYYITGFVVFRVERFVKCEECCSLLINNEDFSTYTEFTDFASKGKLKRASPDVFKIVKLLYAKLQETKQVNANIITIKACNYFHNTVFKGHVSSSGYEQNNHVLMLIKLISKFFLKVVCHTMAKDRTEQIISATKLGLRQKLNKLILFNNV